MKRIRKRKNKENGPQYSTAHETATGHIQDANALVDMCICCVEHNCYFCWLFNKGCDMHGSSFLFTFDWYCFYFPLTFSQQLFHVRATFLID